MSWQPEPVPEGKEELRVYIEREFFRLSGELHIGVDAVRLSELHEEPAKPREGQIVFADGTVWNPGSGRGYYGYRSGAWRKLD